MSTICLSLLQKQKGTMIPMGKYGQPNPLMCDLSMVEHYIMREKKL